jgi:hypothetical protein
VDLHELRSAPDVHRRWRGRGVYVRLVDLHHGGDHLPGWANTGDLQGRRQRLRVRELHDDLPELGVVLGGCAERRVLFDLYEQLLARADYVCVGQSRHVHDGDQRVLGVRDASGVSEHEPELHGQRRFGHVQLQQERRVLVDRDRMQQRDGRDVRRGHVGLLLCGLDLSVHRERARLQRRHLHL